ncbi:DNA-binding HxlR family transcriptional regulator [Streptomyces sp. SAI-117]|uniref:winged helix-turn-helix transcriptional regulator n=1 Tax=unclassified Streptomyces TaxID=2593676 RepID=UPI0024771865|nr:MULTISPECIES: helix-turn-helix domain-containing protein [unclassified Streptomyces]MDH6546082.1 DNA-binding HxlR family transcriptional regulator [Streptomyces sp. SAI-041]MDH6565162.1 DNA-binding HxlR family transcriptional regulator [Streptomyces sp. SAI-117]
MEAMSLPANRYCSIARTLSVLGQKWNLLLLREAFLGRTRFAEFQRIGIPNATLGQRLNDLVCAGLMERVTYQEEGERSREAYVLTDAGRDVLPILAALSAWGDRHLPQETGQGVLYTADDERPVHLEFRDPDGEFVDQGAVSIIRGPAYYAALAAADRSSDGAGGIDLVS